MGHVSVLMNVGSLIELFQYYFASLGLGFGLVAQALAC